MTIRERLDDARGRQELGDARASAGGGTSTLPSILEPAEPDTVLALPHATWNREWHEVLDRFFGAAEHMPEPRKFNYELPGGPDEIATEWSGRPLTATLHLDVEAVTDSGLRREMLTFAEAFYEYELPAGDGVVLTGMLLEPWRDQMEALIAWLRGALVDLTGQWVAAHFAPTAEAGSIDQSAPEPFEPHSDMWHTEMLFNIFNRTIPGQGAAMLMPMDEAWKVMASAGVPTETMATMRAELANAATCADFSKFNGWLFMPEHPWVPQVSKALMDACPPIAMEPGQGYFVNDRRWLHGRTTLAWPDTVPPARRPHRLYRLGYNNRRLMAAAAAEGLDWAAVGTEAAGCGARS